MKERELQERMNEIEDMLSNIELSYTTNWRVSRSATLRVDIIKIRAKNIETKEVAEEAIAYHDLFEFEDETQVDNIIRKLVKKVGGKVKC